MSLPRLLKWARKRKKSKQTKINREAFRELMTGIRIYIKDKDLAVFSNDQLFQKLDMVYQLSMNRINLYDTCFTKQNKTPSKARVENKKI